MGRSFDNVGGGVTMDRNTFKKQSKIDTAMNLLLDNITNKYERFARTADFGQVEDKVQKFADELNVEFGRKYIKIIAGTSVWGFINIANHDFEYGDILKSKNWKTPALNQARGNIFDDVYSIDWTGPLYISGYSAGGQRTCGECGAEIKNLLGG